MGYKPPNLPGSGQQRHTKISSAMLDRARHGDWPGCAPLGYRNVRTRYGSPIVVDEHLAPLVRETFQLAASGQYALRPLLRIMSEKGLVSRNGKSLGAPALWRMLTNPFYTGRIRYYGVIISGRHEALVSDDLFLEAIQAIRGHSNVVKTKPSQEA